MAEVKRFFAALKHVSPMDLEYYLEEEHSAGHILRPIGQEGLLYFSFTEERPDKCAYAVDISDLPRALYVPTLVEKGWEPMGRTMNCYVWRQYYKGDRRPESFADRECLRKHCIRLGIVMLILGVLLLALSGMYFNLFRQAKLQGVTDNNWKYILFGILHLPFFAYFAFAARKLFREARMFRERLEAGKIISKK